MNNGIFLFVMGLLLTWFGPPVALAIIGIIRQVNKKSNARVFYILATVWLLIGGGVCASMLML